MNHQISLLLATLALLAATLSNAVAQTSHDHSAMGHAAAQASAASDGEVRRIDAQAGTITLKHGPIDNIAMPPMTMTFKAANAAMLAKVKVGDKVKFSAEMPKGELVLTSIERAK
ncbi:MAG: copper-binding protein [Rhodoferax sp.]